MTQKISGRRKVEALLKVARMTLKTTGDKDGYFAKQIKEFEEVLKKSDEEVDEYVREQEDK